jgi:hypothetical protein
VASLANTNNILADDNKSVPTVSRISRAIGWVHVPARPHSVPGGAARLLRDFLLQSVPPQRAANTCARRSDFGLADTNKLLADARKRAPTVSGITRSLRISLSLPRLVERNHPRSIHRLPYFGSINHSTR